MNNLGKDSAKNIHESAQKFVDNLLDEGAKVRCDESSDEFTGQDDLPPFYDEQLYKKGQHFFNKHIFGFFFSKLLGLLCVLAIPTILKILIHTKMSGTVLTAYRRYMMTIFHMMVWYQSDFKPGSRLWKSIAVVKGRHNSASKRGCTAGLNGITQKDMALTQFGFMGFGLARSKMVGIHQATEEEWESFLHVWRVVGYLLGIQDRFNLCSGTVAETRERCNILIDQVFRPSIEEKDKGFMKMSSYMLNGLWCMSPIIKYESVLCYAHAALQPGTLQDQPVATYLRLDSSQSIRFKFIIYTMYLLKWNWVRIYQNYTEWLSLWLMRFFPFLAYYQFGFSNAHVNIPVE